MTAVEFLVKELKELGALNIDGLHWSDQDDVKKSIEQAKAMHKREHIETYNQGYIDGEHDASNIPLSIGDISEYNNAENYYNETFKQQEQ